MTELRVVMLIDRIAGGGAERFAVDLATGLAERGAALMVCVSRADPDPNGLVRLAEGGVEVLALGRTRRGQPRSWLPLIQRLRTEPVDLLNTHLHSSNVYGGLLSRVTGARLIATEHGSTADASFARRTFDRTMVARRAAMTVAVSEHTRERLLARSYPRDRVRVIPPAPGNATLEALSRTAARDALGLGGWDGPVIGTVCALRAEKRLDVLIDAAAQLAEDRPIRLVILGEGPDRAAAERFARTRAPRGLVMFAGWRDDASALLAAFDVFALSSDTEGSPLAVIEAMRAGVPIVATRVGGVPALAPDGECALLVPRRDPAALATSLRRLLDDRDLAARLAEGAENRARIEHSLERAVTAWHELLLEVSGASRPLAGARS
jgi:glycosyltransferase involved in cell wall biosynthesis